MPTQPSAIQTFIHLDIKVPNALMNTKMYEYFFQTVLIFTIFAAFYNFNYEKTCSFIIADALHRFIFLH